MEKYNFQELKNDEIFDPTTIFDKVPFTQGSFYGNWQKNLGRRVRRFLVSSGNEKVAYFQLIKYPLLFGKSYFYIPYGPVTKDFSEEFFANLKNGLINIVKDEKAVFIRLDFTPPVSANVLSKFFTKAPLYTYHSAYFQPRVEWFLDLDKSADELLEAMHKNTRYSIRVSEKMGAVAEIVTENFEEYFEVFYELMSETAKRNRFSLHSKKYYEFIFNNLQNTNSYLSVVRYNNKVLVVNLIVVFGGVASNVFGGSSDEERNRMPAYMSQWKAICHAKQLGCVSYNFGGVATAGGTYRGWDGLTAFKKKFGGREVAHAGFFDVVVSPFWYHIYNLRKRVRKIGV